VTTGAPPPPPEDDVPCAVFVELITDYLDGTIPPDLRARVDAQPAVCPGCTSVFEQVRRVIQLAGPLTDYDIGTLPTGDLDRLLASFRAARRGD
jgi:anti-sigma factor RsiW